jgi:hypothetical protein
VGTAHRECVKQVQTGSFERRLNCNRLFRSASGVPETIRDKANAFVASSWHMRANANVFALNDKLSMHKEFHRHRLAAKLNRKAPRFNPL